MGNMPETSQIDGNAIQRVITVDQNGIATAASTSVADQKITVSTTTETTIVTADPVYKNNIYGMVVVNTSAAAVIADFRSTTAGTIRFALEVPAGDTRGFMLPATAAAYKQAAINTNWTIQLRGAATSVEVSSLFTKN